MKANMTYKTIITTLLSATAIIMPLQASAQYHSEAWCPDNGDGTYTNPVINADYSDPDVCAVGDDFYLTASSFNCVPGLPILHSRDLVNWEIIGHAITEVTPDSIFYRVQPGKGVFAPSIRHHNGEFYIYWGDPDQGVFMVKTSDPRGPWSEPLMVIKAKGIIDTTPLWDDDGRCYLVNAWAGSRVHFGSVLTVRELSADGTKAISDPVMVFDGNYTGDRVCEGPKLYKKDGYYWIFAPAGGVGHGWQLAMRSKSPFGPYESKRVLEQGSTDINGPHQGAWVTTTSGEDWFIHFQNKGAYGRVIHLNPMKWENGWPVIGNNGEPVKSHKKPNVSGKQIMNPQESDEFETTRQGLQWQWPANYKDEYGMPTPYGYYRMYSNRLDKEEKNMWLYPNMLLQKLPAEEFKATMKMRMAAKVEGQTGGLIVMGGDYTAIAVKCTGEEFQIVQITCKEAEKGNAEETTVLATLKPTKREDKPSFRLYKDIWLRAIFEAKQTVRFEYSEDGKTFKQAGISQKMKPGKWIGAKTGFFCIDTGAAGMKSWMDVDWFRITK